MSAKAAEARPNEYDIKEVIVVNNGTDELTANLISDNVNTVSCGTCVYKRITKRACLLTKK